MKVCEWLSILTAFTVCAGRVDSKSIESSAIAGDVNDLMEMVPCDQLAALFFEYLATDMQVNKVLQYLTSNEFKVNLVQFETSSAFHEAYDYLVPRGVDIYSWTNEMNRLLDIAQVRPLRIARRAPGEGVLGLVKDALSIVPLADIKEAYNHKLDTNPDFERVMEHLLRADLASHIYTLMNTQQFRDTSSQLAEFGVPINEIVDLVEEQIIDFFDLDSKEEDDDDDEEGPAIEE